MRDYPTLHLYTHERLSNITLIHKLKLVSEWFLFNANSAIFQLYHGENKLIFNEMMRFAH